MNYSVEKSGRKLLKFISILLIFISVHERNYCETLIIPSAGVSADVAVGTDWLYSGVAAVPLILHNGVYGFSASPSLYFRSEEYLGMLQLSVMFFIPSPHPDFLLYFSAGAGPGYHFIDENEEFLPVLQGGFGMKFKQLSLRVMIDDMFKYKYYRDTDKSINFTVGYAFKPVN